MQSLARCLPTFAGFSGPKTYAAWPVWSGSTTAKIKFHRLPKKVATKIWHRARDYDRQTRKPDCHGGAVGPAALQVLHALIFDFLNYKSGQLDPSYDTIAKAANVCRRTVATALQRLRSLGILNWVRRCAESWENGRFTLKQKSNAYAVQPPSQWKDYDAPLESPPLPEPGTWGDHPPLPSPIEQAIIETKCGGDMRSVVNLLEADPSDEHALALACLGRAVQSRNPQ